MIQNIGKLLALAPANSTELSVQASHWRLVNLLLHGLSVLKMCRMPPTVRMWYHPSDKREQYGSSEMIHAGLDVTGDETAVLYKTDCVEQVVTEIARRAVLPQNLS